MKRGRRFLGSINFLVAALLIMISLGPGISEARSRKAKPRTITVMGMLEKEDSGYVVKSGQTKYAVTGQGLERLLGKKVKVTGTMVKKEKRRVLEVSKIQEVRKRK